MAGGCRGDGSHARPLTLLLGGPVTEAMRSLLFTPQNPCGETRDGTTPIPVVTPLLKLHSQAYPVGGECPGDHVLVTGTVRARRRQIDPGNVTYRSVGECEPDVMSAIPWVKIGLTSCGIAGPVIIDSDSAVVMPAGDLGITVWAPVGWQVMGGTVRNDLESAAWFDVSLQIVACPFESSFWPKGQLTEWGTFLGVNDDLRELVRPRRARSLEVHAISVASAPIAANVQWVGEPAVDFFGADGFLASPSVVPLVGAMMRMRMANAEVTNLITWGIE